MFFVEWISKYNYSNQNNENDDVKIKKLRFDTDKKDNYYNNTLIYIDILS